MPPARALIRKLWPEIVATHQAEFSEGRSIDAAQSEAPADFCSLFERLRAEILDTWRSEAAGGAHDEESLVRELELRWASICTQAFAPVRDFDALLARLDLSNDPAAQEVDLLGLLGRSRDETAHTRVLASLLDATRSGALGAELLCALLELAGKKLAPSNITDARVLSEREYSLPSGKCIRPDVTVELVVEGASLLVVIENKVDAHDHAEQLDSYAAWAGLGKADDTCLVYLSPDGEQPRAAHRKEQWRCVSYRSLAIAWRGVLRRADGRSPWAHVLSLYLATIVRHVWRVRLHPALSAAEKLPILPYLRAALGE